MACRSTINDTTNTADDPNAFSRNFGWSATGGHIAKTCPLAVSQLPPFTPILDNLLTYVCNVGAYCRVVANGRNFLPHGGTYVLFGTTRVNVSYLSSFNISFIVPNNLVAGVYGVRVVNVYRSDFSRNLTTIYTPTHGVQSSEELDFYILE